MKKIKLNLNKLKVDSFETTEVKEEFGTVKGNLIIETWIKCSGFPCTLDGKTCDPVCPVPTALYCDTVECN